MSLQVQRSPASGVLRDSGSQAASEEETGAIRRDPDERPYSAFSTNAKRAIGWTASFGAMFSGLNSFIYYPALQSLSSALGVSLQMVNLTITSYLVVAGVAPALVGDSADHTGRRPVYVATFLLFFAANIGLGLQTSYPALLALRMLQSAGASGTIAIAYGVIGDISTPAERGTYVGVLMGFTNTAPSIGPILGGVLAERAGWRWIFHLLAILSGLYLVLVILFFPETCRRLVGDGSLKPTGTGKTVIGLAGRRREQQGARGNDQEKGHERRGFYAPNPLKIVGVLADPGSLIIITAGGIVYAVFGCLGASLSAHCIETYGLDYLQAGLIYLSPGIGGILSSFISGRMLDHDYAMVARELGKPVDKRRMDDLSQFPIEKARLRTIWCLIPIASFATAGYGWALDQKTHLAVPLAMQFLTGSTMVGIFTAASTLLTDLNPERTSTAQAAYNLVRCLLGAAGVAALQAMVDGVGHGPCFTILGGLCLLNVPLLILLRAKGMSWRQPKSSTASVRF